MSLLDVDDEPILIRAVGELEDALLVKRQSPLVASLDSDQSKLYKESKKKYILEFPDYHLQEDSVGRFGDQPVGH